ncbi:hypothetical protein BJ165DRAFT_1339927 [Panaeolus papilionaceus]|nr:hypothetical protein BJ165DRAFT_1339927 [Panaeolus papilionaceus]
MGRPITKHSLHPTLSKKDDQSSQDVLKKERPQIWWSNGILFVVIHIATCVGVYYYPPWVTKKATLALWFWTWQLCGLGITVGYHRLHSHKSFRASLPVRVVLAILGSGAFQGSIKWWTLRHRLHHRYTDDPIHDPYAATRGMFYAHIGWVFFRPVYERMGMIEKDDLENDPVVRYQHKYYTPLALSFGLVFPILVGSLWGDALGGFIWGGLVSKVWIWHCTFLVNSLAHWSGLQPYSDETTARGNLLVALLTFGEGNHNFVRVTIHAFPHDFRSGPSLAEWDPSKWLIIGLHKLGLATGLRRARPEDMVDALKYMGEKHAGKVDPEPHSWKGKVWTLQEVHKFAAEKTGRCVLLIDGYVVDATSYLGEHPGGAALLRRYSIGAKENVEGWREAEWAFNGGLNNHTRAARKRMNDLRIAKLVN